MTKKILVTGFPHCGTTILRALVGNCKNVQDQSIEFGDPVNYDANSSFEFYVWKHPFLHREFRDFGFLHKPNTQFKDTIIIPIIRNPWNVFTSLHKRGLHNEDFSVEDDRQGHSAPYYLNSAERIYEVMENPIKDVYPIRYEDVFENNFEKLKSIFDSIGLEYDDTTFDNSSKAFKHNNVSYVNDVKTKYDNEYRVWQINQPIQNMNGEISVPIEIDKKLQQSSIVAKLGYKN
jgi:hypothetical protein